MRLDVRIGAESVFDRLVLAESFVYDWLAALNLPLSVYINTDIQILFRLD
jgi:hypothetical protein